MRFGELARYLEKLEGTSSRNEMTVILAELFEKTTPEEARLVAYLTQGQLGPAYAAPNFAIAEKMILKALGEKAKEFFRSLGDLGLAAEKIRDQRSEIRTQLKIEEVYERLMEIAKVGGEGSQEKKQQMVAKLLSEMDGVSAKYVVKVILGKLRTGFSDMTVLDALSWMLGGDKKLRPQIEEMYNIRADLGEICQDIARDRKPRKLEPVIGTPILMARCERAVDVNEIWERNGECALEYKLDGLRIQAHLKGGKVWLFSRGLENVTQMYPDVVEGLKKQIKVDCIVEGEMIAEDGKGKFLPFQETMQRKRKYGITEMADKIPLTYYLFDVLVLEGENVMGEPNRVRRERLEKMVDKGKTVKLVERTVANSTGEIEEFFDQAIKDGTEGIIAKKLDGIYRAGARDFNWIKYKESYDKSTLNDTVDAVVMGYDAGQGKRTSFGIGGFLIGVYSPGREKYLTVAKVGTGLTDDEWREVKLKAQKSKVKTKPENYEVSKQMECDTWVEPKFVVEIKADEITKSPMHTSGYALRFPRFIKWREKKPTDTTSDKEIADMYNDSRKAVTK